MNTKKIMKALGIDKKRTITLSTPPAWLVKSQDPNELITWASAFGLSEEIQRRVILPVRDDAPVYSASTVVMRPASPSKWVMVAFGYWSDDKEGGYHGTLALCKDGNEEKLGEQLVKEVSQAIEGDIALWELKHGKALVHSGDRKNVEYEHVWFPEQEGEDLENL
jgi:hypothetical protein